MSFVLGSLLMGFNWKPSGGTFWIQIRVYHKDISQATHIKPRVEQKANKKWYSTVINRIVPEGGNREKLRRAAWKQGQPRRQEPARGRCQGASQRSRQGLSGLSSSSDQPAVLGDRHHT